jgi:ATP-binding cassette, subfamily B, bacterial
MSEAPETRSISPGIEFLESEELQISESQLSGLTVTVGDTIHDGVRASCALPITDDEHYISLRIGATKGEEIEIGMIRDINTLTSDQQRLVRRELRKRYFLHVIHKLVGVKEKFGFLYFEAETNKGLRKFAVRHEYNRVQEYSEFGRMVLDTDDNRYIIPDLRLLSQEETKMFTRYIYW